MKFFLYYFDFIDQIATQPLLTAIAETYAGIIGDRFLSRIAMRTAIAQLAVMLQTVIYIFKRP
ncbi:MAG: hypothetical protein AAFQ80_23630 [Cyanobacteria bacterium J06621_8]